MLAAKYTPPDKDVEDYYKRNVSARFTHPDEVHARHILIAVPAGATDKEKAAAKAKAEDVLKQAQAKALTSQSWRRSIRRIHRTSSRAATSAPSAAAR